MGNLSRWVLLAAAVYVAIAIYDKGLGGAFGGALSWVAPASEPSEPARDAGRVIEQSHFYTASDPQNAGSRRIPVTDAVRQRMGVHMETADERRTRASSRSGL